MADRKTLHAKLCEILGSSNVYFQPPEDLKMTYPCIRYAYSGVSERRANDALYDYTMQYTMVLITKKESIDLAMEFVKQIPMCRLERPYTGGNLYHYQFTLYH